MQYMQIVSEIVLFFLVGALVGSLVNKLSLQWGRHQVAVNDEQANLWFKIRGQPRSIDSEHSNSPLSSLGCANCHASHQWVHQIPVIGWIIRTLRVPCCQSYDYRSLVAIQVLCGALFSLAAWKAGSGLYGLTISATLATLLLIAMVDLRDGFIPDGLLLTLLALSLVLATHEKHWISSKDVIQGLLVYGAFVFGVCWLTSRIAGQGVMGGADQYLLVISGALLGSEPWLAFFFMVIGLLITAAVVRLGVIQRGIFCTLLGSQKAIPAGPGICLGLTVAIFAFIG